VVFESGALKSDGSIEGNDNDTDPARFEEHHDEIAAGDEVQIYETILADPSGGVTTGLLRAVRYLKDNRLLPRGFDKRTAERDIAVFGAAIDDPTFAGGEDVVHYQLPATTASVEVELRYQPIAYRWAQNLRSYDAPEPRRHAIHGSGQLVQLRGHLPQLYPTQIPSPESVGGSDQTAQGQVNPADGQNRSGATKHQRNEQQAPQHQPAVASVSPELCGPGHGTIGLRQCESTHVTQKRVCGRPGMIRLSTGLIGAPQVCQCMRPGIVDLQLGLIGGNLVDDVAIGRGQRTQDSVASVIDVG
jgi:hypothetical protein